MYISFKSHTTDEIKKVFSEYYIMLHNDIISSHTGRDTSLRSTQQHMLAKNNACCITKSYCSCPTRVTR